MLLSEAITGVATEGGFDTASTATTDTVIRGWINEAIQNALAESKYMQAAVDLGPTVALQDSYALPANVVHVRTLRVGLSLPYMPLPALEDLWAVQGGYACVTPGGFHQTFTEDGIAPASEDTLPQITLYPAPTAAGLVIDSICAVVPAEITAASSPGLVLPLPTDVVRKIAVDGAIEIGLERIDNRPDLAQSFGARREAAVGVLTKRANARVGGGPRQLRLTRPRIR